MMARYGTTVVLALLSASLGLAQAGKAGKEIVRVTGQLSADDPKDARRNTPHKVHLVKMKAGRQYTIDMKSRQFDAYLRLEDRPGNQLDEDDDSGGMLDAQMVFNCAKDGEYRVICTSFAQGATGAYTLTVKETVATLKVTAPLVGRAAPDFQGDFAVNGKAVKLSDLKGKVVVLEFWEVRSGASAATFPRLRAWNKAYKGAGLEVIGVTFYGRDINQKLRFDRATGKISYVAAASKESDQALLKDFVEYHKLDYLVMALPQKAALAAFDAYAVNGLPVFVLIDRKGVVRLVRGGEGEQTTAAVEGEIKKLLAEK